MSKRAKRKSQPPTTVRLDAPNAERIAAMARATNASDSQCINILVSLGAAALDNRDREVSTYRAFIDATIKAETAAQAANAKLQPLNQKVRELRRKLRPPEEHQPSDLPGGAK